MFLLCATGITLFAYASNAATGIAGALLLGFGMGSEGDVGPYLIAAYFGRERFGTIYGLTWTAYAIGGATGPCSQAVSTITRPLSTVGDSIPGLDRSRCGRDEFASSEVS